MAAILLAAGESSRMGRPKQLLAWGASSLVRWQVEQLRAAGCDEVVVVLGQDADDVARALEGSGARLVVHPGYREGRASSLRAGAAALPDETEAVVVLSVDQPRPAWVTRRLLEARGRTAAAVILPVFDGHRGHPLLLDGRLVPELRSVSDETLGLRAIVARHAAELLAVPIQTAAVDVDLNEPADYERALASFGSGEWELLA